MNTARSSLGAALASQKQNAPNTPQISKRKRYLLEAGIYASIFLLALLLFFIFKPFTAFFDVGTVAQAFTWLGLLTVGGVAAYLFFVKKLSVRAALVLLLIAGLILRLGYMLYTPVTVRQHDTYTQGYNGHEAYAWTIFSTGKLPSSNDYQFYHPPLNAMLQAGFMHCTDLLTQGLQGIYSLFSPEKAFYELFLYRQDWSRVDGYRYYLYQTCQVLSLTYSAITCVVLVKTLWLFDFSEKTKLLLSAFVIFFPRHILFAGMVNNDPVAYMLSMLAFYHALKWWKNGKHTARVLICGLFLGLGMMAKLSSATICLPIAGVFVYEFVRTLRKKEDALPLWEMLRQYALFLLVCAPIGLWFQIYAKIRFGQGFGFVFSNLNQALYTGEYTFFERFIFPRDLNEIFGYLWCDTTDANYYLFNFALRSALFSESGYDHGQGLAAAAIVVAYLACAALFFALVWSTAQYFRHKKKGKDLLRETNIPAAELLITFLLVQSQVLSEIFFYIKMPYGCTMDFRYIMPLILGLALTVGYTCKILAAEGGGVSVALQRLLEILPVALIATTTLFFCVCV